MDIPEAVEEKTRAWSCENFVTLIALFLETTDASTVLDGGERAMLEGIRANSMGDDARALFVRLLQRRDGPVRVSSCRAYAEIAGSADAAVERLAEAGLVDRVAGRRALAEAMTNAETRGAGVKTRFAGAEERVRATLKAFKQKTVFGSDSVVLQRARKAVGPLVQLAGGVRALCVRMLRVYLLRTDVDVGRVLFDEFAVRKYPAYAVQDVAVFASRDAVIAWEEAVALREWAEAVEATRAYQKDDGVRVVVYQQIPVLLQRVSDASGREVALANPYALRYTPGHLWSRALRALCSCMERMGDYSTAVAIYNVLLASPFCGTHRGRVYERLCIAFGHQKDRHAEFETALVAAADARVRTGGRLDIVKRVRRLHKSLKAEEPLPEGMDAWVDPLQILFTVERSGFKGSYAEWTPMDGGGDDGLTVRVEDVAMQCLLMREPEWAFQGEGDRQAEQRFVGPDDSSEAPIMDGPAHLQVPVAVDRRRDALSAPWSDAIHDEGGMVRSLFVLLLWDVVFDDSVEGVFRTPFQSSPLDFGAETFAAVRREKLDTRLAEIAAATSGELRNWIRTVWPKAAGRVVVWVSCCDRFGVEEVADIAAAFTGASLATLFAEVALDGRNWSGGLPDILLWRRGAAPAVLLAEVKSPNDTLSSQQKAWFDLLRRANVPCALVHVAEIGAKIAAKKAGGLGKRKIISID